VWPGHVQGGADASRHFNVLYLNPFAKNAR